MITIEGPDFDDLARRLEQAGQSVDQVIGDTIEESLATLPAAVKASALQTLPRRGGLAAMVAARVKVQWSRSAHSVTIFSNGIQGMRALLRLDQGFLRHPVHGNTKSWVGQSVAPKFWSRPVLAHTDKILAALKRRLGDIARNI